MEMFYPKSFKEAVKKVYPHNPIIEEALESGDDALGELLLRRTMESIPFYVILDAKSLEELQARAKREKAKSDVYEAWCQLNKIQKDFGSSQVKNL